ncbi:hypothetical protein BDV95DRAFT_317115 [Massariosphaeria phaeospora]|uniref:Uncharacterized protein n=1 Tax=Massariosphaeria phaeospora TaxID=100035 RepID=A0A7C8I9C9_9PLEO|nr:hypothetical protein BDV95DRAFT_317115 [Massariosphaeria phaeospora]
MRRRCKTEKLDMPGGRRRQDATRLEGGAKGREGPGGWVWRCGCDVGNMGNASKIQSDSRATMHGLSNVAQVGCWALAVGGRCHSDGQSSLLSSAGGPWLPVGGGSASLEGFPPPVRCDMHRRLSTSEPAANRKGHGNWRAPGLAASKTQRPAGARSCYVGAARMRLRRPSAPAVGGCQPVLGRRAAVRGGVQQRAENSTACEGLEPRQTAAASVGVLGESLAGAGRALSSRWIPPLQRCTQSVRALAYHRKRGEPHLLHHHLDPRHDSTAGTVTATAPASCPRRCLSAPQMRRLSSQGSPHRDWLRRGLLDGLDHAPKLGLRIFIRPGLRGQHAASGCWRRSRGVAFASASAASASQGCVATTAADAHHGHHWAKIVPEPGRPPSCLS